jgi:hypothetical protein
MSESIYILGHSQTEMRRLINQATIVEGPEQVCAWTTVSSSR